MTHLRVIRIIVPIVAACVLVVSLTSAFYTLNFVRGAKTATGTIVSSATKTDNDGDLLYQPTFAFTVGGRDYWVTPKSYVSPSPGEIGDRISVLYDPRNPSNACVNSFVYTWALPTVTFLLAMVLVAIHFVIAWLGRRFKSLGSNR